MKTKSYEINFDGIVGPTHNYSGLSYGNVASLQNQRLPSNPREAAIQGLNKMKFMSDLGIKQGVLPPHERPYIPTLKALGFTGSDQEILASAFKSQPELVFAIGSAAAMWTANAATISPSCDSNDHLVHFTPANLSNKFHRSIESPTTGKVLKTIFNDPKHFMHHSPLPSGNFFSDEGAANHCRFCREYGEAGVQLFVFGRYSLKSNATAPKLFPARQTFEASQAIARLHRLNSERIIFAQQSPDAIDAGIFHNDVAAVSNNNLFFYHEKAYLHQQSVIAEIDNKMNDLCDTKMIFLEVQSEEVSLDQAVNSYLFNSQLVTLPSGEMALIAPLECQITPSTKIYLDRLLNKKNSPIKNIYYQDLRQSMQNGGGPACLRLRVELTQKELKAIHSHVILDENLYQKLLEWIQRHYRDRLYVEDLADYKLLEEVRTALDDLTLILKLGSVYPFQQI